MTGLHPVVVDLAGGNLVLVVIVLLIQFIPQRAGQHPDAATHAP